MYRFYKWMGIFIEDDCNKLTNHQQRTTSTINEIVLIETRIKAEQGGRRVEDNETVGVPSVDKMIYTS